MVNGNYMVYGDRPSSESEIVDDHVHTRTFEKRKRKTNRSANDLERTISIGPTENDTDSVKYEKKVKEPRLLRYVPTDIEENILNKLTADRFALRSEEIPRRHAYQKKPRNPTDGSTHYAYSRPSSSCSSIVPNLPTIVENIEPYTAYRFRTPSSPKLDDYVSSYENKWDKYFAKPRESKNVFSKVGYNGTHPDSLYRVPTSGALKSGRLARAIRLLRWPAALVTVCMALAVFVYLLMPDTLEGDSETVNGTSWEANIGAHSHHAHTHPPDNPASSSGNADPGYNHVPAKGAKIPEIDFNEASSRDDQTVTEAIKTARKLPLPPLYPSHITPEVQYGNEKADSDNIRIPVTDADGNSVAEDSTLKPHITQKPEKPLAIYFKDGEVITPVETENEENSSEGKKTTRNSLSAYTRPKPYFTQNTPMVEEIYIREPVNANFTSGHSKIFGVPIEESAEYKTSTQSSLYKTKVSPTLPAWRNIEVSTTKNPSHFLSEGQIQCRSTRLDVCRGVLTYDLAMTSPSIQTTVDSETLLTQVEYLLASNCSDRLRHFVCLILEPECSPPPSVPKMPCQNLCKAVLEGCEDSIPQEISPLFSCTSYPDNNCLPARVPCFQTEMQCADKTCVPKEWICDGKKDCSNGEDESNCAACNKNEFRCASGGCIQKRWLCDGYADCAAGEDESEAVCETAGAPQVAVDPGEESSGSAPAPSVRKPYSQGKAFQSHGVVDDSSKELLMTSDTSNNALKRNYTRRPSPSRLTPYSRTLPPPKVTIIESVPATPKPLPMLKTPTTIETTTNADAADDVELRAFEKDVKSRTEKMQRETSKANKLQTRKSVKGLSEFVTAQVQSTTDQPTTRQQQETRRQYAYDAYTAHASPCPSGELRCVDGRCITLTQLCDGVVDCSDFADEDNCFT